jgi:hypothetical protein
MLQRRRLIVPFDEIAHQRRRVDRRVRPFDAGHALLGIDNVADHQINRDPIAERVVQAHGCMLQPYRAMGQHRHRRAVHFGVALGHRDRNLFVRAGNQLWFGVLAVIDERFLNAAKA